MTKTEYIQQHISVPAKGVETTLQLLSEDCTIPFIARYRKDRTGNLDEVQIEQIAKLSKQYDEIVKRKESILKSIEEQDSLTEELRSKIESSFDLQYLEDLYLPYKKKKTKADTARALGLEPLAKIIMAQNASDLTGTASRYISDNVPSEEDALQGARDIIAEWMNEHLFIRKQLRKLYQYKAEISSKVVKAKKTKKLRKNSLSILTGKKVFPEYLRTDFWQYCVLKLKVL